MNGRYDGHEMQGRMFIGWCPGFCRLLRGSHHLKNLVNLGLAVHSCVKMSSTRC